jgi:hypothetical protein
LCVTAIVRYLLFFSFFFFFFFGSMLIRFIFQTIGECVFINVPNTTIIGTVFCTYVHLPWLHNYSPPNASLGKLYCFVNSLLLLIHLQLGWIFWINPFAYTFKAFYSTEMSGLVFKCDTDGYFPYGSNYTGRFFRVKFYVHILTNFRSCLPSVCPPWSRAWQYSSEGRNLPFCRL